MSERREKTWLPEVGLQLQEIQLTSEDVQGVDTVVMNDAEQHIVNHTLSYQASTVCGRIIKTGFEIPEPGKVYEPCWDCYER